MDEGKIYRKFTVPCPAKISSRARVLATLKIAFDAEAWLKTTSSIFVLPGGNLLDNQNVGARTQQLP